MIEDLRDHIIVCGYGRVGRRAVEEFRESGVQFVVLDHSEDALEAAKEHDDLFIRGDGANDDTSCKRGSSGRAA